ncbi:MAG: hypothetical protein FWH11_01660 [Micrococcales bacterium]|nr:hypothetical protein [Micrococcales bacterium]
MTKQLASVETVESVLPVDGADAVEAAVVRGRTVVVAKDEFSVGDLVLHVKVGAALPLDDERFAFLAGRGEKEHAGRRVHVVRAARLRGVDSQGIVFPLSNFPEAVGQPPGTALDDRLGIAHWDAVTRTSDDEWWRKIQPLRVGLGWTIDRNNLWDTDPLEDAATAESYSDDCGCGLLAGHRDMITRRKKSALHFEVHWDSDGTFRVEFFQSVYNKADGSWVADETIGTRQTRNRDRLVRYVEEFMFTCSLPPELSEEPD